MCDFRDTEYKGMVLSLDQLHPSKPAFLYGNQSDRDDKPMDKTTESTTRSKILISPYTQVSQDISLYSHYTQTHSTKSMNTAIV